MLETHIFPEAMSERGQHKIPNEKEQNQKPPEVEGRKRVSVFVIVRTQRGWNHKPRQVLRGEKKGISN